MSGEGRVWERAVLRPFAEQLVDAAQVQPREHVAELLPRSDMLALALAALAPGAAALPVGTADDLDAVDAGRALSLFSAGAGPGSLAARAAARMPVALLALPPRGHRVAADAPPLEQVVADALAAATGASPPALESLPGVADAGGWDVMPVTDVCRFDSVRELVTSLCAWYAVDLVDALDDVVERVAATLADRTGFDGTLRVPATVLLARSK